MTSLAGASRRNRLQQKCQQSEFDVRTRHRSQANRFRYILCKGPPIIEMFAHWHIPCRSTMHVETPSCTLFYTDLLRILTARGRQADFVATTASDHLSQARQATNFYTNSLPCTDIEKRGSAKDTFRYHQLRHQLQSNTHLTDSTASGHFTICNDDCCDRTLTSQPPPPPPPRHKLTSYRFNCTA